MGRAAGGYHYDLPDSLIAQDPAPRREDSRLLVVARGGGVRAQHGFAELPDLLEPDDLLVLNDSRVLPARLWTRREVTGGRVELLLIEPEASPAGAWRALARPSRRLRPGQFLAVFAPGRPELVGPRLAIREVQADGEVVVLAAGDLAEIAGAWGDVPLPPYIQRDATGAAADERRRRDRERYQTVFARTDPAGLGSVAAPTAGLHFSPALLNRLAARGVEVRRVTLHVGPGTFRPPTAAQIAQGRLHPERFCCPAATWTAVAAARADGRRVIAVGTTSLRVLATLERLELPAVAAEGESRAVGEEAGTAAAIFAGRAVGGPEGWRVEGVTRLFLQPPQVITAADGLLTNFHLPGSSLLMLVAAFTGEASWREAYGAAIARQMRLFSYGDAMLILPGEGPRR